MDIKQILKLLSASGGLPGTPQEPWNPAAKIVAGLGMPKDGAPPPATSTGGAIGNAIIPQTMAAKGGANGGG